MGFEIQTPIESVRDDGPVLAKRKSVIARHASSAIGRYRDKGKPEILAASKTKLVSMDEPYQEKHGAILLKCAPTRNVEGRFIPRLIATRLDRNSRHETHVELPPSPPFDLASSAAEFALAFGKRWIRERLMGPESTY